MPPEVAAQTAFFKQFWSDSDNQLKLMDAHQIEKAVLLYPTSDAHLNMGGWVKLCEVYNPAIAALVKRYPDRFIGAGIIPIDEPQRILSELQKIESLGLRMISLASSYEKKYLDDPVFNEVYEFARKRGFPIHVHPQILNPIGEERLKDPLLSPVLEYVFDVSVTIGRMMMGGVFLQFPDVKFIFAHYGGVLPIIKERFDTTYQMLKGRGFVKDLTRLPSEFFKNIYLDMSGSASVGTFQAALEVVDPSNLLWGSDYPANRNYSGSLNVIANSLLNFEEKSLIQGKNLSRILTPA
jgi:predicted TIM-barrel fold metal-dependent hydrolase